MAMDQNEQYRQFAEGHKFSSQLSELFAKISEKDGDEAGAEQARRDQNCNDRFVGVYEDLIAQG